MFRKNDQHLQMPMFSSIDSLPDRPRKRLDDSWAGTYYHQVFVRIDEEPFAVLYADDPSRPNTPINVLVSLDTLKSGYGWSDEEMHDHFSFDVRLFGISQGKATYGGTPIRRIGDNPQGQGKGVGIESRPEGCHNSAA